MLHIKQLFQNFTLAPTQSKSPSTLSQHSTTLLSLDFSQQKYTILSLIGNLKPSLLTRNNATLKNLKIKKKFYLAIFGYPQLNIQQGLKITLIMIRIVFFFQLKTCFYNSILFGSPLSKLHTSIKRQKTFKSLPFISLKQLIKNQDLLNSLRSIRTSITFLKKINVYQFLVPCQYDCPTNLKEGQSLPFSLIYKLLEPKS